MVKKMTTRNPRKRMKRKLSYALYLTLGLVLSSPASAAQPDPATNAKPPESATHGTAQLTLDELRTFTDVFSQVRDNYIEEVDDKTLLESAINGMLNQLDPHSAYLPNKDFEDLENSSRGQYVGLGLDVAAENGRMVVKSVISPSPADTGGINPGDVILAVDRKPVKGRPVQEAIDQLNGPSGSAVELLVQSPGEEARSLTLKREYVKVPALSYRLLEKSFGYFDIAYFHRQSAADLEQALASIQSSGTQLRGLILDLRNNPGGVLQPAIDMADGFLDDGEIVSTRGRNHVMQMTFTAKPGQWLPGVPLVLLVDRGTASASEVLAGALQDHGRALIVGERTFGKGSVQTVLPLRNGAGIKLTTARYYTPSGRSIQAQGIVPDVLLTGAVKAISVADERKHEADLQHHLDSEPGAAPADLGETVSIEKDYPLHEALNLLRATLILSGSEQEKTKLE
jgi:carboxyl-terminal processing protease